MQQNNNLVQQQWLYKKLLKITPKLQEHLQMGIQSLESHIEGERSLYYFAPHKESDDVYYITLEQSDADSEETRLVTSMQVRISLADQTAIPVSYSNEYEDRRVDLDENGDLLPQREHAREVYTIFKNWMKSLDHRGYRLSNEAPAQEKAVHEIRRGKSGKGIER